MMLSSGLIKKLGGFFILARYLYICILKIYGGCSSVGRVEDCDSFGHGFKSHHSPKIKITGGLAEWTIAAVLKTVGP